MKEKLLIIICVILCLITLIAGVFLIYQLLKMEPLPKDYTPSEQPQLYEKEIDVVVKDVDQKHWFAANVHCYELQITVYSEEYGITETITEASRGMFNAMKYWDAQEGDIIKVRLYYWVMNSTGQVVRREIKGFA